jgi:hypothetical protein
VVSFSVGKPQRKAEEIAGEHDNIINSPLSVGPTAFHT